MSIEATVRYWVDTVDHVQRGIACWFTQAKATDIARGIAAGLIAAHAKGILHRDLEPANVMLDSHGDARIRDFGLALVTGEDDGTISGSPAYMAPQLVDGTPASAQSDLYALGPSRPRRRSAVMSSSSPTGSWNRPDTDRDAAGDSARAEPHDRADDFYHPPAATRLGWPLSSSSTWCCSPSRRTRGGWWWDLC